MNDSSVVQARVETNDRYVVIRTSRPTDELPFPPEAALQFAEAMARGAYNIRYGTSRSLLGSDNMRAALTERQRELSVNRVLRLLVNMQESTKPPAYWAAQIVDSVFSQIS